MADVYLRLSDLQATEWQLAQIITEFEKASDRADDLEDAIGDPFGKSELREAAEDFEDRWNLKRDELKGGLEDIKEQLHVLVESFTKLDRQAAIQLKQQSK